MKTVKKPTVKTEPKTRRAAVRVDRLVLHLVLTGHWYDETVIGAKRIEYRDITDHWLKRIWERRDKITHVRFSRGYTKTTQTFPVRKIDLGRCPIPGWDGAYYRIHFLQNVPDHLLPLAFGTKACSAGDVPKVPKAW